MTLIINNTFTPAFSSQTGFVNVVNKVISDINVYFNLNGTADYRWDYGSSPGSANTSIQYTSPVTYATMRSLLTSVTSDALKTTAYNSTNLPTVEAGLSPGTPPVSGMVYDWAVGLDVILKNGTWSNNYPFTYIGTTISNAVTWSTALDGSTASGQSSLYGVVWHEFSEAFGRGTSLTSNISPLDLFVFSAPGTRSWTKSAGRYFSYDNGATNATTSDAPNGGTGIQGTYNSGTGDWGGWGGSYVSPFNEQNFTTSNGKSGKPLPGDIMQLAALGWTLSHSGEIYCGLASSGIGHGHSFSRNL